MILSAIWDKSAQVNFSKANQIVVFEKFTSADLSQISREKSCDYLLIIYMQKFDCFPLIMFILCDGSLVPPTLMLLVEK